ncbi:UNVERIFIED_CONTAM: hypothetical protein PYX00_003365 [Menopon gallinae]|uniref:Secreted protein n=1 Tax=Menopon gallinae TaxID=328185 RepID=A0AAW2HZS2_9NEOP
MSGPSKSFAAFCVGLCSDFAAIFVYIFQLPGISRFPCGFPRDIFSLSARYPLSNCGKCYHRAAVTDNGRRAPVIIIHTTPGKEIH